MGIYEQIVDGETARINKFRCTLGYNRRKPSNGGDFLECFLLWIDPFRNVI